MLRESARLRQAAIRAADPERHRQKQRDWRSANPKRESEIAAAAKRRQREKDPELFLAQGRERGRAWAEANPERRKEISHRHILKSYGLTSESYAALLAQQNGMCAICDATTSGRKGDGRLLIDHDHETGYVRGLLCHPCNQMLGNAKDSADRLRAGAAYLERLPQD